MRKKDLDELDLFVLRALQDNPKTRVKDLATKLNVPKSTIYYK